MNDGSDDRKFAAVKREISSKQSLIEMFMKWRKAEGTIKRDGAMQENFKFHRQQERTGMETTRGSRELYWIADINARPQQRKFRKRGVCCEINGVSRFPCTFLGNF
jgi:hypothetical protein